MHQPARYSKHGRGGGEAGFTLIELLVVITILGVLAAVVVFAVQGVGDKGQAAAAATDAQTLQTAEEADCAKTGTYASPAQLQTDGFLATQPTYNSVVLLSNGPCTSGPQASGKGSGFLVGSAGTQPPSGGASPLILAASNTSTPFNFLSSSFINQNGPIQFTYGASGTLKTQANTAADPSVAFFSADKANVDAITPAAGGGTCSGTCLGTTEVEYAHGQLVVFSCKSGGTTLAPAQGSPTCAAPAGGYLPTPPTSAADVQTLLTNNPTWKVAIPTPTGATAPYGVAAAAALENAGVSGISGSGNTFTVTNPQVVKAGNVTQTQTQVVTGAVQMAFIPRSFVQSPASNGVATPGPGNDTNNWTTIAEAAYTAAPASSNPIQQYATVLNKGNPTGQAQAQAFLNYVTSPTGQSVLTDGFGYLALP